jgi:hypothetical protein
MQAADVFASRELHYQLGIQLLQRMYIQIPHHYDKGQVCSSKSVENIRGVPERLRTAFHCHHFGSKKNFPTYLVKLLA